MQPKRSTPPSGPKLVRIKKPEGEPSGRPAKSQKVQVAKEKIIVEDDKEIQSKDAVKEVKSKATKATKVSKEKLSSGVKPSKKPKAFEIDKVIKKVRFIVKTDMSLDEILDEVVKHGNLKPMFEWYDNFDDNGKMSLEEATIKYLNVQSRALVEIMSDIPKSLSDSLEMRRKIANEEDERLRDYVIVNLCPVIVVAEMNKILQEAKPLFRSKIEFISL